MSSKTLKNAETWTALALIAIAVIYRLMPHPQNFTPVSAIAIFAAATLPLGLAFTVPILAMIGSDILVGPHDLFWLTWGAFALMGLLGLWLRERRTPARILLVSVAGSTFFFLVTNFGVLFFQNMYAKTWAGLVECFTMALPFYRNELAGDLVFCAVFFGVFALAGSIGKPQTSSASPRT